MNQLLSWLHVGGLVVSLGGGLCFVFVVYPALQSLEDRATRMKYLAKVLQYYHPLFLFGICLTFMTGAIRLTSLKIGFGPEYYAALGKILLIKFGLTLLIFLVAGMQCFGMGLKLGRMANGVIPGDIDMQERYARKIRKAQAYNLVFLAIALFFGLKIVPLIYSSPSSQPSPARGEGALSEP